MIISMTRCFGHSQCRYTCLTARAWAGIPRTGEARWNGGTEMSVSVVYRLDVFHLSVSTVRAVSNYGLRT